MRVQCVTRTSTYNTSTGNSFLMIDMHDDMRALWSSEPVASVQQFASNALSKMLVATKLSFLQQFASNALSKMLVATKLLLAVVTVWSVKAANSNFKNLLFYTCVTPQVGNQCEEGYTLDQAGIATQGFSSNFTTIEAGKKQNITTLFAVHDTFFENGIGLRKDWKARWSDLRTKLDPYIKSKTVVGFFVGDELFPGKISVAEFMTALKAIQSVKKEYAEYNLITWENEGGTQWVLQFSKGIPEELDVISLDDYYMWTNHTSHTPQGQVDGHRQWYEKNIYPLLKPHQMVYLVPGSYATHDPRGPIPPGYPYGNETYCYHGTFAGCDDYMADQADAFAAWAFDDSRVAGIAPWHWDTRKIGVVTPFKEVGVVDMPKTKATWKAIHDRLLSCPNGCGE
jgi:hypothetical protein